MIRKQDILDRAAEWQLRPEIVERDYVLGWLLAGLAELPFRDQWVFKGGTCIKKCYFETYRFSEDLDFSLRPDAAYTQEEIVQNLQDLTSRAAELSGLEFPPDLITVKARRNQQMQDTFEGRVSYRGPLVYPGTPKILFDLTRHEPLLEAPNARPLLTRTIRLRSLAPSNRPPLTAGHETHVPRSRERAVAGSAVIR